MGGQTKLEKPIRWPAFRQQSSHTNPIADKDKEAHGPPSLHWLPAPIQYKPVQTQKRKFDAEQASPKEHGKREVVSQYGPN